MEDSIVMSKKVGSYFNFASFYLFKYFLTHETNNGLPKDPAPRQKYLTWW